MREDAAVATLRGLILEELTTAAWPWRMRSTGDPIDGKDVDVEMLPARPWAWEPMGMERAQRNAAVVGLDLRLRSLNPTVLRFVLFVSEVGNVS
jgi:hypothetical protein